MPTNFSFISLIIGLLRGMIIMLLLVWFSYFTRTFLFTYCPTQARPCGGADYYNNPGDAIANGANINDILFINDDNQMLYKRVPKVTTCVPQSDQIVVITYPQYCAFTDNTGTVNTFKTTAFESNIYKLANGLPGPTITTTGNCVPSPGTPAVSGEILLDWDPNPLS